GQVLQLLMSLRHDSLKWQKGKMPPWPRYSLNQCKNDTAIGVKAALSLFRRTIVPTPLDRKRLELICKKIVIAEAPEYYNKLGEQLLIFRGRGGSGKTIRLLQLANHLREERDS